MSEYVETRADYWRKIENRAGYVVYLHEIQAYDWSDLPLENYGTPKMYRSGSQYYLYDKATPDIIHVLYDTAENSEDHILNGKINLEINKAGSFEFDILPSHTCYSMLRTYIQYISVVKRNRPLSNEANPFHNDSNIDFYGRISEISVDMAGTKHVVCEGLFANLMDVPMYNPVAPDVQSLYTNRLSQVPDGDSVKYLHRLARECVNMARTSYFINIRKDIYPGILALRNVYFPEEASYDYAEVDWSNGGTTICDATLDYYINTYGGLMYMEYYSDSKGDVLGQIHYEQSIDLDSPRVLTFGDNILDISFEHEGEISTAVIPIWRSAKTKNEDGTYETQEKRWGAIGGKPLGFRTTTVSLIPQFCGYVGEQTVGAKILDLPDVTNQNTALQIANKYFNENCKTDFNIPFNSITVKCLDDYYINLEQEKPIALLTPARIVSEAHGIDVTYPCLAIEINIDNPFENTYTFKKYSAFDNATALAISKHLQRK